MPKTQSDAKPEASRANMAEVDRQVVEYLYQDLLGRGVDEASITNCVTYLREGGTVLSLRDLIINSEEFKARSQPRSSHPLAHIEVLWKPENISYFTHRGQYRPLSLMVETVNICNNDCIICPYSAQTRRKQHMPLDLFKEIIRQYTEIGGGPIGLTPMVGEILLDKLLLERLQMLREAAAITAVSAISNASMAHLYTDAELAHVLSHFDRLSISIYGLDGDEFRLMTRKNGYERFRRGLVRILSIMGPEKVTLGARQLRHRPKAEMQDWALRLALDAGVDPSKVQVHGTSVYADWSFFDTSQALPLDATWLPARTNTAQCALPLISAQILSDGMTSFCGCANFDGQSELNIGNVAQTTLREMMASERVRQLWNWQRCGTPDFCKTCTFHMPINMLTALPQAFAEPLKTFGG